MIDGEGAILRQGGVADFDRLHSRRHDDEVQLLGFDTWDLTATTCAPIQLVAHFDEDDGGVVFAHACRLGLEGIVSKRRDGRYQHGRSRAWLKIKNPASAAMLWVWEERF